MKFTVLGSGLTNIAPGLPYRYPSAHLLETNGKRVLLDSGIGVLPQLAALNLQISDIDVICISHFHADHFNLSPLLQALFVIGRSSTEKPYLHIVGPPTIEQRVRDEYISKGWKYETDLLAYTNLSFAEYSDGESQEISEDIHLTPFKTEHFSLDAYALRIEAESALAYSGDSTVSTALTTAAQHADVFVCEAAIDIGAPSNNGHVTAYEAGGIAQKARAKQLCLVHYSGTDSAESMEAEVRKAGYIGDVAVAVDLSSY